MTHEEVAARWAPIHYQDTDTGNATRDYITAVDYDGNWVTTDNWDLDGGYPLSAHVYYSVVETCTHWFVIYDFYHPRDWDSSILKDEHECHIRRRAAGASRACLARP